MLKQKPAAGGCAINAVTCERETGACRVKPDLMPLAPGKLTSGNGYVIPEKW